MHDGKWIDDVTPDTPLAEAARHVLTVRLGSVAERLPRAMHEASGDVEHVHQLRVATRRARAALDIFAVCLTQKAYRAARKHLRKIRRAAGAARDWDVFLANLTSARPRLTPADQPVRDLFIGYALAQRRAAETQLAELGDDAIQQFEAVQQQALDAIAPSRTKQTLRQMTQMLVIRLMDELEQAMAGNLEDYTQLHQVRIAGKRLRYAMEIFADCYEPAFREDLYPAIEAMQEILGLANDSHVALGRIHDVHELLRYLAPRVARRFQSGLATLATFHTQRLAKQRTQFARWRSKWSHDVLAAYITPCPSAAAAAIPDKAAP